MTNYNELLKTWEMVSKSSRKEMNEFIDEVTRWWSNKLKLHRRDKPLANDPEAAHRLNLFYDIEDSILTSVHRDSMMTNNEFLRFEAKVLHLWELQKKVREYPHPSLWHQYALGAIKSGKFEKAEQLFRSTFEYLENEKDKSLYLPDRVKMLGDYVRALYLFGNIEKAFQVAEEMEWASSLISPEEEEKSVKKYGGIPLNYFSSKLYSYFVNMDLLVHHPAWNHTNEYDMKFNYFKHRSVAEFKVPAEWHIQVKIIICTDDYWLTRKGAYAKDIAEELYIQMGDSLTSKFLRSARIKLWGLFKDFPHTNLSKDALNIAASMICLIYCMNLTPIDINSNLVSSKQGIIQWLENGKSKSDKHMNKSIFDNTITEIKNSKNSRLNDICNEWEDRILMKTAVENEGKILNENMLAQISFIGTTDVSSM